MKDGMELRGQVLNLVRLGQVGLGEENVPRERFNFGLSLTRFVRGGMVMQDDVISQAGEGQGEGFPQSVCGAGDEGEGSRSRHVHKYTRRKSRQVDTDIRIYLSTGYLSTCLPVYFLKKFEMKNQMLAGRSARRRMK